MNNSTPFPGIPDNLKPNPPGEMPAPQEAGDAVKGLSPFTEAQDVDAIIAQLTLDRPLKLYIPNREKYTEHDFRIINSIPQEMADAHNKGWKEVTDPELSKLFTDLVAGTDKTGKAYRPILCARPKKVTEHVQRQQRLQLRGLYAGMDPTNKDFGGKYTNGVDRKDGTFLDREGSPWRIRV
jgi:hypothetical protein